MRIPSSPPPLEKLITGLSQPEKLNALFRVGEELKADQRYLHWDARKRADQEISVPRPLRIGGRARMRRSATHLRVDLGHRAFIVVPWPRK